MIRLFTALSLPVTVRNRLGDLEGGIPGARWVDPEEMHITLRFIGEVDENIGHDIDDALSAIRAPAFRLSLSELREFGGKQPHALFAAVPRNEALFHLVQKVETALRRLGLAADARKYTPHVTLARLKNAPYEKIAAFIAHHNLFSTEDFEINTFTLFSSHPGPGGSHYVPERIYPLEV
ncbi:MAG: RNA 2',3'-cyclic phosphodiesterase [Alphaproteobacteria bacterium]|nr:RNA 2',3'-cyclic phosphodiesterase [Alphaproteobacteria bacterium]